MPTAKIRIAEWVCFYLPATLKFAPNPLAPQPCRAIVIPKRFFATKFHSTHIWNLPQKFPLIFLTSLSLQPREVQREKKHALTTAQYVFPTCCAGPVPLGQEANTLNFLNQHSHKAKDRNVSRALHPSTPRGFFFSCFPTFNFEFNREEGEIFEELLFAYQYSPRDQNLLCRLLQPEHREPWLWGLAVLPLQNQSLRK